MVNNIKIVDNSQVIHKLVLVKCSEEKHFQAELMGLLGKHGIQMQSVTLLSAATMS